MCVWCLLPFCWMLSSTHSICSSHPPVVGCRQQLQIAVFTVHSSPFTLTLLRPRPRPRPRVLSRCEAWMSFIRNWQNQQLAISRTRNLQSSRLCSARRERRGEEKTGDRSWSFRLYYTYDTGNITGSLVQYYTSSPPS